MKVYVDTDERYPDYLLHTEPKPWCTYPEGIEVDAATFARWQAAIAEYDRVQDEIAAAAKRAKP